MLVYHNILTPKKVFFFLSFFFFYIQGEFSNEGFQIGCLQVSSPRQGFASHQGMTLSCPVTF